MENRAVNEDVVMEEVIERRETVDVFWMHFDNRHDQRAVLSISIFAGSSFLWTIHCSLDAVEGE